MDRNPRLPFHFQPRTQKADLWSISCVDVDRVVRQVDVETLQNHLNMVTFCSVQEERCWRCQNPLDPSIIKLFRLGQLSVEWLHHCHSNMGYELRRVEEKLVAADMENQKLQHRVKELTAELKSREKIIRSQQLMIPPETMSLVKCPRCNKIFMNSSYLQKHMKRDHAKQKERLHTTNHKEAEACERTSLTESYKMELSSVKEQLAQQQQVVHVNNEQLSELQRAESSLGQHSKQNVRQPHEMEKTLKEQGKKSEELQLKQVQPECEGQVTSGTTCTSPETPHDGTALGPGWQPPRQTPSPSSPLESDNIQVLKEVQMDSSLSEDEEILKTVTEQTIETQKAQLSELQRTESSLGQHSKQNVRQPHEMEKTLKEQDEKFEKRLQLMQTQHESENIQVLNELRRVQSSLAEHQEMLKTVMEQISEAQRDQGKKSEELQLKQVQPECEGQVTSGSTCTSPETPHDGTALGPGWQPPRQTPSPSSPLESDNIQVLKEVQMDSSLSEDEEILKTVTEQTIETQKAQERWLQLKRKIMELKDEIEKPQVLNELRRLEASL